MNEDPELLERIDRLSSLLIDLMAQLDDAISGPDIPPRARALARQAREAGEDLIAAVKQLDDAASLARAERMAACAAELDRDINGGTLH